MIYILPIAQQFYINNKEFYAKSFDTDAFVRKDNIKINMFRM